MSGGAFVLLVSGPAGAGKSAAADAWASAQEPYSAHIELDAVREFVRSGWSDPRVGWNAVTDWQYAIARRNCVDMARRYVAEGITCVIDDAIFPLWEQVNYAGWSQLLAETPHYLIVLLPSFATVAARNVQRHGRRLLPPDLLRTIYDMMLPWRDQQAIPVLASSSLTIAQTAQRMQRVLDDLRGTGDAR